MKIALEDFNRAIKIRIINYKIMNIKNSIRKIREEPKLT